MSQFPAYVDGKPPVVTLQQYDEAAWARDTAVDSTPDGYVALNMNDPTHIVARLDQEAGKTLDLIFKSAKEQYTEQQQK